MPSLWGFGFVLKPRDRCVLTHNDVILMGLLLWIVVGAGNPFCDVTFLTGLPLITEAAATEGGRSDFHQAVHHASQEIVQNRPVDTCTPAAHGAKRHSRAVLFPRPWIRWIGGTGTAAPGKHLSLSSCAEDWLLCDQNQTRNQNQNPEFRAREQRPSRLAVLIN